MAKRRPFRTSEKWTAVGIVAPAGLALWATLAGVDKTAPFWVEGLGFSWSITLFWVATGLAALAAVVALSVARAEGESDAFEAHVNDMFKLASSQATHALTSGDGIETVESALRMYLMGIAGLAEYWDTGIEPSMPRDRQELPRYTANSMPETEAFGFASDAPPLPSGRLSRPAWDFPISRFLGTAVRLRRWFSRWLFPQRNVGTGRRHFVLVT